jgi:hypothetical protein
MHTIPPVHPNRGYRIVKGKTPEDARAFHPWAFSVFLFIHAGSALSAEGIIADNASHLKEMESDKRNGWIWALVMPLTAMAYLALGFIWNAWHPGWLVFPVAAMACTGITEWRNSRK